MGDITRERSPSRSSTRSTRSAPARRTAPCSTRSGRPVDRTAEAQRPELFPLDPGGLGDGLFLDGTVEPVPATFTVSHGFAGWEVDAGLVHGLRPPDGDEAFVLACTAPDGRPAGAVRVTSVTSAGQRRADRVGDAGGRLPGRRRRRPAPAGRGPARSVGRVGAGGPRRCRRRARGCLAGRRLRRARTDRRRRTSGSSTRRAGGAGPAAAGGRAGAGRGQDHAGRRQPDRRPGERGRAWTTRARPGSSSAASSTSPAGSRSACSVTIPHRSPTPCA